MSLDITPPCTASVVIPARNEGDMLAMTVQSILEAESVIPAEIIIVDDGSTDGSCERYRVDTQLGIHVVDAGGLGVARARNRGAEQAVGEMIVFLDAHCQVSPHWLDHLAQAMRERDVALVSPAFTQLGETQPVGLGMGWSSTRLDLHWFSPANEYSGPYEIPLAPGGCQAYPATVFRGLGRFDEGFSRWGSEDIEISLRAWLLGYRILAEPNARVAHWFRETRGFQVDESDVVFNLLRMIRMHFTEPRLSQIVDAVSIAAAPMLPRVRRMLDESDVEDLRTELLAVRERDDGWFCDTFFPTLFRRPVTSFTGGDPSANEPPHARAWQVKGGCAKC